jgi:CheY-like chemotaxis protein
MHQMEGLSILVVGDRRDFADPLSLPLRADGHLVGEVADADLALAAARDSLPDVVVFDADIAGLDAPAVARKISVLSPTHRPLFIALTGEPVCECPPAAGDSRIDLYLGKPGDTAHLRSLLRRFQSVVKDFEAFDPMI